MEADKTIRQFLDDLAAETPTPGGGSVAALAGALASGLAAMTGRFTTGRKRYADAAEVVDRALARADAAREVLIGLIDADMAAYASVIKISGLPKETPDQAAERTRKLQDALIEATRVPLRIAAECADVVSASEDLVRVCNPNLVGDAAVGAILAEAALQSVAMSIHANLGYIKDPAARDRLAAELERHQAGMVERRAAVVAAAAARLSRAS